MSITKTQYRDYIMGMVDDRQRQERAHRHLKAGFVRAVQQVLDEYELVEQLKAAKSGERLRLKILDVGCGEGLYLHDLAEVLEERDLLQAGTFYGTDINQGMIETAIEYARLSKPPRPYLNFYVHDIRQPFETQGGLFVDRQPYFDFIFARSVLSFLPHSQENLTRLYAALAPGGVLYLRDIVWQQGEEGWLSPHPALTPILEMGFGLLEALNYGVQVASATADWLRQTGASLVQAIPDRMVLGGTSKPGMENLGDYVMSIRNAFPVHIAAGRLSQAEADRLMSMLYRELGPQCQGQQLYIETLARKPILTS